MHVGGVTVDKAGATGQKADRSGRHGMSLGAGSNFKGILAMVIASITFVSCDSFLKLILRVFPPLEALMLRGVFATLWCFLLVLVLGYGRQIHRAFGLWTLVRAMFEVCAVFAFVFALARVPLASITAIYQIAPLIVLAGASVVWHEKVGLLRWLLIAFGFAGALLVAQPGADGASPFALLGLITALSSAIRDLLSRRVPLDVPGPVITFSVVLTVLVCATLASALTEVWQPLTFELALYGAASGFFVMLGHLFVFLAFRLATARAVSPFYYGLTVCAAVFGALFFGEWPNTLALTGILVIISCGLGVLLLEKRERPA
jgi:drug/metabolite transporter (DMT)-like permease